MHVEICWMYRVASYISDDPCEMIRVATGNASSSWDRGMGELVDLSNCPNAPKANSYFFHRVKPSLAHCGTWILQVLMLHAVWSLQTWVQGQSRQCEQQWTTWWTAATAGGSDRIWACKVRRKHPTICKRLDARESKASNASIVCVCLLLPTIAFFQLYGWYSSEKIHVIRCDKWAIGKSDKLRTCSFPSKSRHSSVQKCWRLVSKTWLCVEAKTNATVEPDSLQISDDTKLEVSRFKPGERRVVKESCTTWGQVTRPVLLPGVTAVGDVAMF